MKHLFVEATEFTPKIHFNPQEKYFGIEGISRPENGLEFYDPIIQWVKNYRNHIQKKQEEKLPITFNIKMIYFNSSSAKFLIDILLEFIAIDKLGKAIDVNWHYEDGDDEILESGEEIAEIVGLTFNFLPYTD